MPIGLYVHIPFCKQKCLYCDFNSYAGLESEIPAYCAALCKEIDAFWQSAEVDSIYFGGGTPTVLGAERLVDLLSHLKKKFRLTKDCEITAECNPGTIDKKGLQTLYRGGFNRLSIGLQSCENAVLKSLGRIHTFEDFKNCFINAKEAGFENLSLDLMYGLPGQTVEAWKETLSKALAFSPAHISCYALKIEEGTPFFQMDLTLPEDEEVRDMYDAAVNMLGEKGYSRYEISNFAKAGKESRHNMKYWLCDDFAGFGAGAYSCLQNKRYANVSSVLQYRAQIEKFGSAIAEQTELSVREQMSEFCFLGLRMTRGIAEGTFQERFSKDLQKVFGDTLEKNLARGTMEYKDGWYRISPEFLYVSNAILADFV